MLFSWLLAVFSPKTALVIAFLTVPLKPIDVVVPGNLWQLAFSTGFLKCLFMLLPFCLFFCHCLLVTLSQSQRGTDAMFLLYLQGDVGPPGPPGPVSIITIRPPRRIFTIVSLV